MKKFALIFGLFLVLGNVLPANAEMMIYKNDYERLVTIGEKLLTANNIDKRLMFGFSSIGNFGVFPILMDTSRTHDYNLHNNRIVTIYTGDFAKAITDDEVAALIAPEIAQGVHSYTGILNGQLFFTKNGIGFIAKKNELEFDRQAVDYLVSAGYNPTALINIYNKILPDWRGTFWGRHNKAEKRIKEIKKYISKKYPEYI